MFDTGEEHGRIVTGEGKGKKHGPGSLLHGPHATEILVISSVAGVLLMYLTFRKAPGSSSAAPAAGVSPTGISAGDVAGFDQASVQGLTDNLQTFQQANAAAFQSLTDALTQQGTAEQAGQQQITDAIGNQTTAIGNGFSALPQQIAAVLPHAQVNVPAPVTQAPAPAPSAGAGQFYTVRAGDNLSTIAARYPQASITAASIGALNGIRNLNLIHPGQNLRIY